MNDILNIIQKSQESKNCERKINKIPKTKQINWVVIQMNSFQKAFG